MADITTSTPNAAPVAVASRTFGGNRAHVAMRLALAMRLPLLPLAILVPFVILAVFANWIAPYDPTEPIPGAKIFEPPIWMVGGNAHALLGTDFQSRDILSRLIFGARVSLIVGVF